MLLNGALPIYQNMELGEMNESADETIISITNNNETGEVETNTETLEVLSESQVVVDEEYCSGTELDEENLTEACRYCKEHFEYILPHLMENKDCLLWYSQEKLGLHSNDPLDDTIMSDESDTEFQSSFNSSHNTIIEKGSTEQNPLNDLQKQINDLEQRLTRCETLSRITGCTALPVESTTHYAKEALPLTSGDEEVEGDDTPEYFDEDYMTEIRKANVRPVTDKVCLWKSSMAPRRSYIQKVECRHCGARIKYILSHLCKSFRCQVDYDMTKLREEAHINKKLRQKYYERQHFSILRKFRRHKNNFETPTHSEYRTIMPRDANRKFGSRFSSLDNQILRYPYSRGNLREKKKEYYLKNAEQIRAKHREYNTIYRKKMRNKQLRLELKQYHQEMEEKGIDVGTCEEVIRITQKIMQSTTSETDTDLEKLHEVSDVRKDSIDQQITKFKPPNKVIKLTQAGKSDDIEQQITISSFDNLDETFNDTETLHFICKEEEI